MELDVKKSKALKIFLLVLTVIILLSIGAAMGSHFGRNRGYSNNGYGCGRSNNFERYIKNGRQDGRQFRMMVPQNAVNQNGQIQYINQVPAGEQAIPVTTVTATTTTVK